MKFYINFIETNEAGEQEQIFSTEETVNETSTRSANKEPTPDDCAFNRSDDQPPLSATSADEQHADKTNATNLTDEISDQLSMIQLSSTPLDSLAFDSIPPIENKDCEYLKLVLGFKRTLVLPDVFFAYDIPICYCSLCVSSTRSSILEGRFPELWFYKSKIKNTLFVYIGWVRFKLNQQVLHANKSSTDLSDVSDWTNAFYLSRVDKIRAILDHGQPLPIGKSCIN